MCLDNLCKGKANTMCAMWNIFENYLKYIVIQTSFLEEQSEAIKTVIEKKVFKRASLTKKINKTNLNSHH